jgi:hypothetical protein
MKTQRKHKTNPNRTNLWIDMAALVAFLAAFAPYSTGIPIHEWLGIAVGGVIIVHLLLHWDWIDKTTRSLFGKMPARKRINAILNALFFIDTVIIIFTGLIISEVVLPVLGITIAFAPVYITIHNLTANIAVLITGLHIALHWKWIVKAVQRFVIAPFQKERMLARNTAATPEVKA